VVFFDSINLKSQEVKKMKKFLALIGILAMVVAANLARADPIIIDGDVTIGQADLMTWVELHPVCNNHPYFEMDPVYPKEPDSIWVDFTLFQDQDPDWEDSGLWADGQVGWDFENPPLPEGQIPQSYWNLSAYDGIRLLISNHTDVEGDPYGPGGGEFMASITINTGWIDEPYKEDEQYAQSPWTWIEPGQVKELYLDFNHAEVAWDPTEYGPVNNRHHVTSIAVGVGSNYPGTYKLDVDPVPEPATILLVTCAWFGMIGYSGVRFARKKRKGRC
jgi:hypothetical protein